MCSGLWPWFSSLNDKGNRAAASNHRFVKALVRRSGSPPCSACLYALRHSLRCGCKELEWFALLKVGRLVADYIWLASQSQLPYACAFLEVDLAQLHPQGTWAVGVLVIVDTVLLVRDRQPDRR